MFNKVVVTNRGVVAARVLRTLRKMGIRSVSVYSEADAGAPYLAEADETYAIGAAPAKDSYLNQDVLLEVLRKSGADGVHPGYGFLAENSEFASRVMDSGVHFIGPSAYWIDAMGHKTRARELAIKHGLPVGKGSGVLNGDVAEILAAARAIGFPVLVKPAAGGGGIGMIAVHQEAQLHEAVERAGSMAQRGFASGEIYLEKLLERPRHIEFQILGDSHGAVRHLFERDCSVQRRHQKIIEEATAPGLERGMIESLADTIAATLQKLGYNNIGTVEMLMGADGTFSFLEMNTRLQVEHGVTEEITGIDLVEAQIRSSAGEHLDAILPAKLERSGHALQARVYAEDPKRFFPSPGTLTVFRPPHGDGIRIETGYAEGRIVTPHYDPMLAKVIVHEPTRGAAIDKLCDALENFEVSGVKTNISALLQILRSDPFREGQVHTGLVAEVMK